MASTPASELAQEIVDSCLFDGTWPARALDALIERALDTAEELRASAATRALFSIVIERLGDLFEPALCDVYVRLFSYVISRALPEYDPRDLVLRYNRIRQVRRFPGGEVQRVFVLSRVTLGADIAVTSLLLAAAKDQFPNAEIVFVGPPKNAEMFAADSRIVSLPVLYGRSSLLRDRLSAAVELKTGVDETGAIVIDPDSRLTQLGLIPICDDSRYFFFESRAFGGELDASLTDLTAAWLSEVFDTPAVKPYVAPLPVPRIADIAVSLGVGENTNKRLGDDFEFSVLSALLATGQSVLLDRGAGGEEADRVNTLVQKLGSPASLHLHDGSYASFASHILQSNLYFGYDSAGQHVASAGGVPLISVFAGHVSERMLSRWHPTGPNARVIEVTHDNAAIAIDQTLRAIEEWSAAAVGRRATV